MESFEEILIRRFLGWKLPESFSPDNGISFDKTKIHPNHWPVGTNLLNYNEAREMIRYILTGIEEEELKNYKMAGITGDGVTILEPIDAPCRVTKEQIRAAVDKLNQKDNKT